MTDGYVEISSKIKITPGSLRTSFIAVYHCGIAYLSTRSVGGENLEQAREWKSSVSI